MLDVYRTVDNLIDETKSGAMLNYSPDDYRYFINSYCRCSTQLCPAIDQSLIFLTKDSWEHCSSTVDQSPQRIQAAVKFSISLSSRPISWDCCPGGLLRSGRCHFKWKVCILLSIRPNCSIRYGRPQHPVALSLVNMQLSWNATPVDTSTPRRPNPVYPAWRKIDWITATAIWCTSGLHVRATSIYSVYGWHRQGHPSTWSERSQLRRQQTTVLVLQSTWICVALISRMI